MHRFLLPVTASMLAMLAASAVEAQLRPTVVTPPIDSDELFVASLRIDPPADAGTDAAPLLQAAIDRLHGIGGGVLYAPPGTYRLEQPVTLREGVTLLGAGQTETTLAVYGGEGSTDGPPAVTMERGSGLRYCGFWYPEQSAETPREYPWTLHTSSANGGDNITIEHVRLVNPYLGISIGPEWNELHTIRQVTGTPLHTGIAIDTVTDIGRVVETVFDPAVWIESDLPGAPTGVAAEALRERLLGEAVGVDMGRSDWQYIDGLTVRGYSVGLKVRPGAQGTTNGVLLDCHFTGCGEALRIERLNGIGLAATWCTFEGTVAAVSCPESFDTVAAFNACRLIGHNAPAVLQRGSGTLMLTQCELTSDTQAVDAATGSLLMQACRYGGSKSVVLGEKVRRARILGSAADEPAEVVNLSAGDVQVAAAGVNPELCPAPAPSTLRWAKLPTRLLIDVTDHGAGPELADNTAAFQAALEAAREAGGGTVYVPAGNYRFAGQLTVPSGVELRGIFDVPHHTQSAGSVLMPTADRGNEDGLPFVSLQERSGLRGLTFWYPEQDLREFAAYPWTVRSLGPGCWLRDVTCGNSYNGVDFWTHPSDGHVISYLAGAFFRRALAVSKCTGAGWVEDVQMNPHYSARLPAGLPHPEYQGDPFGGVIDQQRHYLEGLVFGRCDDEQIRRTFLYAAYDGIAFRDDGGGANATVLIHGSDTVSRSAAIEASGERGIDFVLAQLVPLSAYAVGGIVTTEGFNGRARFFCNQMWAGEVGGRLRGGEVLIQQWINHSGPLHVEGGKVTLESGLFPPTGQAAVVVGPAAEAVRLVGNTDGGPFRVAGGEGRVTALANSASVLPSVDGPTTFGTAFEDGQPQPFVDTVAEPGGGIRAVSNGSCRPVDGAGRDGSRGLRIAGTPDADPYAFAYFRIFDGPVQILDDTVLRYWLRPGNEKSRQAGIDLLFADGGTLRDLGVRDEAGAGTHPSAGRGQAGEWLEVVIPLRQASGRAIRAIMLAYDSHEAGPFEAVIDDLSITSALGDTALQVTAEPAGGPIDVGNAVSLRAAEGVKVVYTLDGSNPTPQSAAYTAPIRLAEPGLRELRYAVLRADGTLGPLVLAALYEVRPGR